MTEEHLDQVMQIEERSYPHPWQRGHFQFELRENPWAVNWVLERGDRVLGYLAGWRLDDELKINNLAVHPDWRGQGLGKWLLREALDRAAAAGCTRALLEVRVSNDAARGLYGGMGFREIGRRKNYYVAEGEDALLMAATLAGPRG